MYEQFAGYELITQLAESLTGRIHLAQAPGTGQLFVIKEMLLEHESALSEAEQKLRFERETRFHCALDHPNIVKAHTGGESDGRYYLVLDYAQGTTLQQVMESGQPAIPQVLNWGIQLCSALQYMYDTLGLVHRDIKPANIIISPSGQVRITDFGLARVAMHPDITQTKMMLGTLVYMSPEQLLDPSMVDNRADIFAVGAVLFKALTGTLPFAAEKLETMAQRLLYGTPDDPCSLNPLLPRSLGDILLRCLAKDSDERYPSARALSQDLARELKNAKIYLAQGQVHGTRSEWKEAAHCFQQACALDGDDPFAWFHLGDALEMQGQADPAFDCFLKVVNADPAAVQAYRRLGRAYRKRGDKASLDAAVKMLERAWTLEPEDRDTSLDLVSLRVMVGKDQDALELVSDLVKRYPECARSHLNAGRLLYKLGRWPEALAAFRMAHRIEPRQYQALFNLASLTFEMGRHEEAEDLFLKAIALDTSQIDSQHNLAMLYFETQRYREAEDLLRHALGRSERMASLALLGKVLLAQGRPDEAVEVLSRAIDQGGGWDIEVNLAEALSGAFRYQEAILVLRGVANRVPAGDRARLFLQLSRVERTAGNGSDAVRALRECLGADPEPDVAEEAQHLLAVLAPRSRGTAPLRAPERPVSGVWRFFGLLREAHQ
ncbi:MAG: protein kinase [Candidatus Sericytochromatia bacterium]|nr:protein kinase [Candidatus Tanganyikabacteria bacterium]